MSDNHRSDLPSPPVDWKRFVLGESFLLRTGSTPLRLYPERYYRNGTVRWVKTLDLNEAYIYSTDEQITETAVRESSCHVLPKGTVLIAMYGGWLQIGRTGILGSPAATNQAICGLTVEGRNVDPDFLLRFMQAYRFRWKAIAGSTRKDPNITKEDVARFEFAAPPLPQQRKIARILTTLDNVIEKTEALIAKYQAIKQGLMHDLFTRGVDATGKLRPPQSEAPELYKQSDLGWIPKEWECGTIDDYCEIHNQHRLPISAEEREKMQGEYPYYGPTGIFDWLDHYRVDGEYALIGEDGDHFLKFATHPMTILANGKFNVNNHAHLLMGKNGCTTQWVFTFFCHRDIKPHLTHQGAGRLKLNKAALRAMPLVVPPIHEQSVICERFRSVNVRVQKEKEQVDKCRRLKTGLMQDLLTGKVRVNVEVGMENDEVEGGISGRKNAE